MDTLAGERIEVNRQSSYESLTFTSLHLGNLALMEAHTANHLNIEMTHTQHAPASLTGDGKSLRQNLVKSLAGCQPLLKFIGMTCQCRVGQILQLCFIAVNLVDYSPVAFNFLLVVVTKKSF